MRKSFLSLFLACFLFPALAPQAESQTAGEILTYAGNGSGGYAGDGGPATNAALHTPYSVAVDKDNNLYIADSNNYCVRQVSASTGIITTVAGVCGSPGFSGDGGQATSAELAFPSNVALDNAGNLYICDSANRRIRKVTAASGVITTVAGNGTEGYSGDGGPATQAELDEPAGIGVDGSGNLYIDDSYNDRIRKVDASTGTIITVAGNGSSGYTGDGGQATGATLDGPTDLAVSSSGDFYFLDQNNAVVRKVTAKTGIISTVSGNNTWGFSGDGGPATSAQIFDAGGIGLDSAGNLYIADSFNQRIRRVDASTGIITTVAGNGGQGYAGDGGPALEAELSVPSGVTTNSAGDLYVADTNNNRIREIVHGGKDESFIALPLPYWPQLYGEPVELTATVSGLPGLPTPTGTITFYDQSTTLGSVELNTAGNATITVDSLSVGSHPISAFYSGDAIYSANATLSGYTYPMTVVASQAATPVFGRRSGTYNARQQVTLSDASPGVAIFYTTDGSIPVPPNYSAGGQLISAGNSTAYLGAITVSGTETIRAVAVGGQYALSHVINATYVIDLPQEAPLLQGEWAWESGGNDVSLNLQHQCSYGPGSLGLGGVYGTIGVPAAANTPGSRRSAIKWTDPQGNFWLFGGFGFDSTARCAELNDLWMFNPSSREWTWMSGNSAPSNSFGAATYGTMGQFAPGNVPGSRELATTWTDQQGHLWLFGGFGYDSTGAEGTLNDLWEFDPGRRQWAWIGGSNVENTAGVYGTWHTPASSNTPGARWGAASWSDRTGNLWLFGGDGYDVNGADSYLNDLWKFDPVTKQWAWMGGGQTIDWGGGYGAEGLPGVWNIPGAREGAAVWNDNSGYVWLFGGIGYSQTGTPTGLLDDLWKFDPYKLEWTWMGGLKTPGTYQTPPWNGQTGVYGDLRVPEPGNLPGSRTDSAAWTDEEGNLWLFGGNGYDSAGNSGILNDLWEYVPSKNMWAWMGGADTAPYGVRTPGVYGQLQVPAATNFPGSRTPAASWTDRSGKLWLFGGEGYDVNGNDGLLNDLWTYSLPEAAAQARSNATTEKLGTKPYGIQTDMR